MRPSSGTKGKGCYVRSSPIHKKPPGALLNERAPGCYGTFTRKVEMDEPNQSKEDVVSKLASLVLFFVLAFFEVKAEGGNGCK